MEHKNKEKQFRKHFKFKYTELEQLMTGRVCNLKVTWAGSHSRMDLYLHLFKDRFIQPISNTSNDKAAATLPF